MGVSLRLVNGSRSIDISSYLPTGYLKGVGARGFGVAPTSLTFTEGIADGGRHKNTRRGMRDIDLPIVIFGESRSELETKMRELVRTLNDTYSVPRLYVTYDDGTELYTDVYYAGGADHTYGQDTNSLTWVKWVLTLRSPSPYWTSTQSVSYSLTSSATGRGLIKAAPLSNLEVSSSQTIGNFEVENPGDVPVQPVWTVFGPGDSFTAGLNGSGLSFSYDAAITLENPVTFNTITKKVTDALGNNVYSNVGVSPRFFAIPPGQSTVLATLVNSTGDSLVQMTFQPQYEVVL